MRVRAYVERAAHTLPRIFVFILACAILVGCAPAAAKRPAATPGWTIYSNGKYGYEIQYPEGYDLWETGLQGQRDGASIRIGRKEYQAPTPMLDIQLEPRTPTSDFQQPAAAPEDLQIQFEDVEIGGLPARQATYRWKQNGDLAFVEINLNGVLFQFMAGPGTKDLRGTSWWEIISTFQFTK